jgi:hypothetical protein
MGTARREFTLNNSIFELTSFKIELVITNMDVSFFISRIIRYNNLLKIWFSELNNLVIWKNRLLDSESENTSP